MPSSSLLLPSGLRPNTGVYWTKIPLLGSWRKTGSVPMPSPLVALPTSVAKPVCWAEEGEGFGGGVDGLVYQDPDAAPEGAGLISRLHPVADSDKVGG